MADDVVTEQTPLEKVNAKELEFNDLWIRMDADRKLYLLDPYVMTDETGKKVPDVEHVTLPGPMTFAERTMATLAGANMQTVIESADVKAMDDKATHEVEEFLEAVYEEIDKRLEEREIPGLLAFAIEQACLRGRIAARCCLRMEGDKLVSDVVPPDTRYLTYQRATEGLEWAAPKTMRSKAEILSEYGHPISGVEAEVTDFWDAFSEIVYVDKAQVKEEPNTYGYPPFVIVPVISGSMFQDKDSLKYTGESIYRAARGMYPEKNTIASVVKTLTKMTFLGGLQYRSSEGADAEAPDTPPYGQRFVVSVEKDGGFLNMPINDITRATNLYYAMIDGELQRASLPSIDYGNLTFPLSAVAITRLTATKDQIFLPRLQSLARFYQALSRMIIKQYIALNQAMKLGIGAKRKEFAPSILEGDYEIKYKFFASSPEQDIANYSIAAAAASQGISRKKIMEDILKLEDPVGEYNQKLAEDADMMIDTLRLHKMAKAKIELGEDLDARVIAQRVGMTLQQILQGQMKLPQPKAGGNEGAAAGAGVPLFGGGQGGTARAQKSPQKEASEIDIMQQAEGVEGG